MIAHLFLCTFIILQRSDVGVRAFIPRSLVDMSKTVSLYSFIWDRPKMWYGSIVYLSPGRPSVPLFGKWFL